MPSRWIPEMARLDRAATAGLANVCVLNLDALAGKNTINPAVLDQVRTASGARQKEGGSSSSRTCPYNIATPLITNLLVQPELCPELPGGHDST